MKSILSYAITLLTLSGLPMGYAAVMPLQSRLIFHPGESEQRLMVVNRSEENPVILQAWVDNGQGSLAENPDYPFTVIPPVLKLGMMQLKNLRVITSAKVLDLPKDRESMFYINLFEVPGIKPATGPAEQLHQIKLGLNSQLKVIYRPVADPSSLAEIVKQLDFSLISGVAGESILRVINHSPYFVTPKALDIQAGGKNLALTLPLNRDIIPFGQHNFSAGEIAAYQVKGVSLTLRVNENKAETFTKDLSY